jgi:PAS domain S-box-containing protein
LPIEPSLLFAKLLGMSTVNAPMTGKLEPTHDSIARRSVVNGPARDLGPRSSAARYGSATLAAVAAALFQMSFAPALDQSFRDAFAYLAVLVVALYAGFGPGLLCLIVSAAASLFFVRFPGVQHVFATQGGPYEVISFLTLGLLIAGLASAQRRARLRLGANFAANRAEAARLAHEVETRKQVESALRSSESRLAKAQHIAHLGNWEWDLAGKDMLLSDEAFRILGMPMSSGSFSFESLLTRVHPHDRNGLADQIDAAIKLAEPCAIDVRIIRPDGVERIVNIQGEADSMEADRATRLLGTMQDISERKRVEQELRASEERTRLIIESALDAVILMDAQGAITGWNAQAQQIFGWKAKEVIGKTLAETIVPQQYRQSHKSGLRRFLSTGKGRLIGRRIEMAALHRDGREFPVELSISPIELGDTIIFSAFVRDIQDRKRNEEALKNSNEMQKMLLSELNHRVRNNLAGLISLIDMSVSAATDIPTLASTISNRVMSMAAVHSMLSHTSWGSLSLEEMVSKLLPHGRRGMIEVEGEPVQIPAHQCTSLGMVIGELMANSLKYGALSWEKGRVLMAWRDEASANGTQTVRMTWQERGGPPIEKDPIPQLGTSLIKGFLRSDLQGEAILNYPREGVAHEFIITLDHSHHPLVGASK